MGLMRHAAFRFAVAACTCLLAACGAEHGSYVDRAADRAGSAPSPSNHARDVAAIRATDLSRHISILASDGFEGRAPLTPGGEKTRSYIAAEFERVGLKPVNGGYYQPVPLVEATLDPEDSYLRLSVNGAERELAYRKEAVYGTKRATEVVAFEKSDVVFAGYGVVAPEWGWNDYEGLDVRGKTVLILVNDPGFLTGDDALFNGQAMTYYGRWTYKYEEAARQGAAAALIIHDDKPAAYGWGVVEGSWSGPQIDIQRSDDGASRVAMEGWLAKEAARTLLKSAGKDLDALTADANRRGFKPVPLEGVSASGRLSQNLVRATDGNVLGLLEGSERPDEYVLYMAHWDHLGVDPGVEGDDKIFNGAVDNATGIAALIELAEAFAAGPRPKRSILFVAVTAEESGLLGSAFFADNPPVPLKQIAGGVNIDGVLPLAPAKDVVVVGYGASELEDILKKAADRVGRYLRADPEPEKGYFYRSDHISLAKKGVPMLYADGGTDLVDGGESAGEAAGDDYVANRYHKPSDEYSPDWDLSGLAATLALLRETGEEIANMEEWPNWREGNEFRALRDEQRTTN